TLNKETMRPHTGVVQLILSADGSWLAGDYETDRFRNTNGRLKFHRGVPVVVGRNIPEEEPHAHT
ncbi:MAG TPA: hypothetical protein VGS19_27195, partial [Streptosporangiaceae bacterium]|nr:hypothetical protein [Streptosporangiaceae bacterium]